MTCGWRRRATVDLESHGYLLVSLTSLLRIWLLKQDDIDLMTSAALLPQNTTQRPVCALLLRPQNSLRMSHELGRRKLWQRRHMPPK